MSIIIMTRKIGIHRRLRPLARVATVAASAVLALPSAAWAQVEGQLPAGTELPAGLPAAPGNVTVYQVPGAAPAPAPRGPGINDNLPSSSRPTRGGTSDGFDLGRGRGGGSTTVRGNPSGAYVVAGQYTPEVHTVKRGDTLWGISQRYFGTPYNWPRIWAQNHQIQNPHWLYPGDHIRLRGHAGVRDVRRMGLRRVNAAPNTVFQRHLGHVLDGNYPVWGEVVGSPEDQMLLSQGDKAYVQLEKKHPVHVGDELVIFETRKVKSLIDKPFVWVRGRARIDRYNKNTGMARVRITESYTTIERGIQVGPAERSVDVVKPVRNKKTVQARIVGALYPYEFYGQHQVVFINKGKKDGVEVGNRFFAVRRGDEWRRGLTNAGNMARQRAITEDDRYARTEEVVATGDARKYPAETYGELRVLRVREHTATCLITASTSELPRGATLVAREGY